MSLVKSFPNWPIAVVDALAAKRAETPHGCGGCIHATWTSLVDGSRGPSAPAGFSIAACRAAVQLERGSSGLRAALFCTSWNMPLGGAHDGNSVGGGNDVDKLRHRPLQGANVPSVAGSPSLRPLFR